MWGRRVRQDRAALRSAFKAAYEREAVALLAPTTVLASSTSMSFVSGWPSSRWRRDAFRDSSTRKPRPAPSKGIKAGQVDNLRRDPQALQRDGPFQRLGLLIAMRSTVWRDAEGALEETAHSWTFFHSRYPHTRTLHCRRWNRDMA